MGYALIFSTMITTKKKLIKVLQTAGNYSRIVAVPTTSKYLLFGMINDVLFCEMCEASLIETLKAEGLAFANTSYFIDIPKLIEKEALKQK